MDDDVGMDDKIGGCTINLEDLNLGAKLTQVDSVLQSKTGWFSKDARIFLEISFME